MEHGKSFLKKHQIRGTCLRDFCSPIHLPHDPAIPTFLPREPVLFFEVSATPTVPSKCQIASDIMCIYSFNKCIQHIFTEHLLYTRHCFRSRRCSKKATKDPLPSWSWHSSTGDRQ